MATQNSEKPIHSIIIDTGPLINNTVSISTIINTAEVLYTTPAIIAEIRDPATRSRVETTLLPFLNVKTPSPASFEAVSEFSKKTGDFSVLSKQDLGILALAYEVHCEKNGGSYGLRSLPKGPVKLRPEEQAKIDEQNAKNEAADAKKNAKQAAIQRRKEERQQKKKEEKAAAKLQSTEDSKKAFEGGIQISEEPSATGPTDSKLEEGAAEEVTLPQQQSIEEPSEGTTAEPKAQVSSPKEKDGQKKRKVNSKKARRARAYAEKQALTEQPTEETSEAIAEEVQEQTGGVDISESSLTAQEPEQILVSEDVHQPEQAQEFGQTQDLEQTQEVEQVQEAENEQEPEQNIQPSDDTEGFQEVPRKKLHPAKARLARRAAELEALATTEDSSATFVAQQPTPPATDDEESDGGEWITPGNLQKHQSKDTSDAPFQQGDPQLGVATMTTDYAMQNVLLQMNLHLLSPAMQRIRHARSTVLRCHACFLTTREMDKQFCPRCGQPTLQRVSCSTSADGEFQIHLSSKYQHNKRGDKYSIPKPVGGTSNGKMRGPGGGKGGWGRELVLSEDQKEYQKQVGEQKRSKARDPMDQDYLPGILTGDRSKAEGRPKVGAGRNVNSRKRV